MKNMLTDEWSSDHKGNDEDISLALSSCSPPGEMFFLPISFLL